MMEVLKKDSVLSSDSSLSFDWGEFSKEIKKEVEF